MLLRDELDGSAKHFQVVDISGVSANGRGQSLLLRTSALMGGIEQRGDFRVVRKHPLVKVSRQGFSMLLEDGSRGFHDIDGPLGQHIGSPLRAISVP
jgi:hypothetical protein